MRRSDDVNSRPVKLLLLLCFLILAASIAVHAAAGPKDIVLVLDNSGSMKKNDPSFLTGVAVREFLDRLDGDNRVAILLFDQTARLVMPLTPLTETSRPDFLLSVDKVDYRGLWTNSPAAIERAIYELRVNGREDADKSIVFMTDGIVDTGDKAMDAEKSNWMREELAGDAADEGIRIFGIAFTDNADFLLIQSLSKTTSGEYFRAYSAADIEGVFGRVIQVLDSPEMPVVTEAPMTIPEPVTTFPEPPLPQAEPDMESLADVPVTAFPEPLPEITQPDTEPALPTMPEPAAAEAAEGLALPTLPETDTGAEALPLPDATTATEEAGAEPEPAAAAETSPEAVEEPEATPPPAPPPPALVAKSGLPLPLPILVAIGAGLLALLAAIVVLVRRKSAPRETPAEQIPKAYLNDLDGISEQQSYELGGKLTVVGRLKGSDSESVNYVVIPEATIGRVHSMIEYKDHSFWVIDQGSLNGTFVNNKRIEAETRLKHGDRLRFHKHEFEFLVLDMFETDRTMMGETLFADVSSELEVEDDDVTRQRQATGSEKTTANPAAK
jgi:pSer/pThr/pTyr-binding forkhead associated (FHA) protein